MPQKKNARRWSENEVRVLTRNLKGSPQKLNLVAEMIRGRPVEEALALLAFSPRRAAQDVGKTVRSAVAAAENDHQLDVDRLYVAEATVGKSFVMKRFQARARGRAGKIRKPFSLLHVVVRERAESKSEES